jgi:hypothetical protein
VNVRRGLFRIWVVISALWIGSICLIYRAEIANIFVADEPPQGQGAIVLAPGPYACWALRNSDNPFAWDSSPRHGPGPPDFMDLAGAWQDCLAYKMAIPALALLPPIILIVLGYVVTWILRGFTERPQQLK